MTRALFALVAPAAVWAISCASSSEPKLVPRPAAPPLFRDQAVQVIEAHRGELADCYRRTAGREGKRGRVWLALAVSSEGVVADVQVHQSDLHSPSFHQCLTQTAQRWAFPLSSRGLRLVHALRFDN